jgi:hypothetical protein
LRAEDRARRDAERYQQQAGEKEGAKNLVDFEGIHRGTSPARGMKEE